VEQAKAGNIDTTASWNRFSYVFDLGVPSFATATYGQTITAPVSGPDDLTSFTFYISDYSGSPQALKSYVYQWNSVLGWESCLLPATLGPLISTIATKGGSRERPRKAKNVVRISQE
jgi:hypothetical protein